MMPHISQHFTIRWYYEYRETFRLTADSRLHIAMDCGCGSLVKLCGLMRIIFYDPHTSVDVSPRRRGNRIHSRHPVLPPPMKLPLPLSSAWTARKLSGQSTIIQLGWSRLLWLWHGIETVLQCYLHVLHSAAACWWACRQSQLLKPSAYVLKPRQFGHHVYHTSIKATIQVMVVYRPNDCMGWYNKTNPNVNSNLGLTTKVWILGKTKLKIKLYYKTSEECYHTTEKCH